MGIMKEFREFAVKGNAMDMAVGIIVGAAFGKIVTSLVNDVVMPPVGMLMGNTDFSKKSIILKQAIMDTADATKVLTPAVEIRYGAFINTVLDFLIVAFCIFMMVKMLNKARLAAEKAEQFIPHRNRAGQPVAGAGEPPKA